MQLPGSGDVFQQANALIDQAGVFLNSTCEILKQESRFLLLHLVKIVRPRLDINPLIFSVFMIIVSSIYHTFDNDLKYSMGISEKHFSLNTTMTVTMLLSAIFHQ